MTGGGWTGETDWIAGCLVWFMIVIVAVVCWFTGLQFAVAPVVIVVRDLESWLGDPLGGFAFCLGGFSVTISAWAASLALTGRVGLVVMCAITITFAVGMVLIYGRIAPTLAQAFSGPVASPPVFVANLAWVFVCLLLGGLWFGRIRVW